MVIAGFDVIDSHCYNPACVRDPSIPSRVVNVDSFWPHMPGRVRCQVEAAPLSGHASSNLAAVLFKDGVVGTQAYMDKYYS